MVTHDPIKKLLMSSRYFWFSVLFHLLFIWLLCQIASKPLVDKAMDKRVTLSISNSYRMNMQQRVKNIAAIQNDLVNTLDDSVREQLKLEPISAEEIENPKVTSSKLLALAQKISENIRKIERELRVQDLQKAVLMSRDDVIKRVLSMEVGLPAYRANTTQGSTMVKMVKDIESNAQNSLRNREGDIKKRGGGSSTFLTEENSDVHVTGLRNTEANLIKGIPSSLTESGGQVRPVTKNDFVDLWLDHIPAVNRQNPKKVAGRIIKNSGQSADRLFVNSWYMIGPFAGSGKNPPDYAVDLDGVYYGKDNATVAWQYVSNAQYPLIPPQANKAGVFYGYTEVMLEREQDLWVWIGADDFASLELNDRLIWNSDAFNKKFNDLAYAKNSPERNNWNLTEYKRLVHFRAGRNTFKFKLTNSDNSTFFSLVLSK